MRSCRSYAVDFAVAATLTRDFDPESRVLMQTAFYHLTTVAVLAVLAVLVLGLATLLRGKSPNLSQKLMRWRIGLQFVAILVIMAFVILQRA